jgi:hypothetical protein
VEECFLDAEEVEGSIPSAPTIKRSPYSIRRSLKACIDFHLNTYRFEWQNESAQEKLSLYFLTE